MRDVDEYNKISQKQYYDDQLKEKKKHKCCQFGNFNNGVVQILGNNESPFFKLEMARIDWLVGRHEELYEVCSSLKNNQLTTVLGFPGIGKSILAKSVGLYVDERDYFQNGIIYISMNKKPQTSTLISELFSIIKMNLSGAELQDLQIQSLKLQASDDIQFQEQIVENYNALFDGLNSNDKRDLQKSIFILENKNVLLIIDDIQDCLQQDKANLKKIIQQVLDQCKYVKFLLTSTTPLHQIGNIKENSVRLKKLSNSDSVKLFLDQAEIDVDSQEDQQKIVELLCKYDEKVFEGNKCIRSQLNKLEDFQLFKKLNGHPHIISAIGRMAGELSLKQIDDLLLSNSTSSNSDDLIQFADDLKENMATYADFFFTKDPKSKELFCLLGLMPDGITENSLDKLLGEESFVQLICLLRGLLIEKKEQPSKVTKKLIVKYQLISFLQKFSQTINLNYYKQQRLIRDFFMKLMANIYQRLDVEIWKEKQDKIKEELQVHEQNLLAYFQRLKDIQEKDKKDHKKKKLENKNYKKLRRTSSQTFEIDLSIKKNQIEINKNKKKDDQIIINKFKDLSKNNQIINQFSFNNNLQQDIIEQMDTDKKLLFQEDNDSLKEFYDNTQNNLQKNSKINKKFKIIDQNTNNYIYKIKENFDSKSLQSKTLRQRINKANALDLFGFSDYEEIEFKQKQQHPQTESEGHEFIDMNQNIYATSTLANYYSEDENYVNYQRFNNINIKKKKDQQLQLENNSINNPENIERKINKYYQNSQDENQIYEDKSKCEIIQKKAIQQKKKMVLHKVIPMPINFQLLIYYSSNLIINGNFKQASDLLSQFMDFNLDGYENEASQACKSNLRKLFAIALFKQDIEFLLISQNLDQALKWFEQNNVFHGVAVCSLIQALFFFQKSTEFKKVLSLDEHKIHQFTIECFNKAIKHYEQINHIYGAVLCDLLREIITEKKLSAEKSIMNTQSLQKQIIIKLKSSIKEEPQKRSQHQFKYRTQAGMDISLFVEVSNHKYKSEETKGILENNIIADGPVSDYLSQSDYASNLERPINFEIHHPSKVALTNKKTNDQKMNQDQKQLPSELEVIKKRNSSATKACSQVQIAKAITIIVSQSEPLDNGIKPQDISYLPKKEMGQQLETETLQVIEILPKQIDIKSSLQSRQDHDSPSFVSIQGANLSASASDDCLKCQGERERDQQNKECFEYSEFIDPDKKEKVVNENSESFSISSSQIKNKKQDQSVGISSINKLDSQHLNGLGTEETQIQTFKDVSVNQVQQFSPELELFESIQIVGNLTPEQQEVIELLQNLYEEEQSEAQRQNYRAQLFQYFASQGIQTRAKGIKSRPLNQSVCQSQEEEASISFNNDYYGEENSRHGLDKSAAQKGQKQNIRQKIAKNQRRSLKALRHAARGTNWEQPAITEVSEGESQTESDVESQRADQENTQDHIDFEDEPKSRDSDIFYSLNQANHHEEQIKKTSQTMSPSILNSALKSKFKNSEHAINDISTNQITNENTISQRRIIQSDPRDQDKNSDKADQQKSDSSQHSM